MISAGMDIGIENIKVVLLSNHQLLSHVVVHAGTESTDTAAEEALRRVLEKACIQMRDIDHIAATGTGKSTLSFIEEQLPEFMCLAKGVDRVLPSTKTVLDLGAHHSLAMRCHQGRAIRIATNDKCAAATARCLQMAAMLLGIRVEEMTTLSLKSKEHLSIQSNCAVFAESEIISLIHTKKKPEDILKAVFTGLAQRVYPLLVEVGLEKDVTIVGGMAKSIGIVKAIEELVGYSILVPDNPEVVGALGAALIAGERRGFDRRGN